MKNLQKKFYILIFVFALFFGNILNVLAETTTELHFCEYPGVLRTFKIIGILITICKIVVPLILIFTVIVDLAKIVVNGKQEELTGSVPKFAKKIVAGLVVFMIPTVVNFAIEKLADATDNTTMTACSNCMLNQEHCVIPDKDPVITTRD